MDHAGSEAVTVIRLPLPHPGADPVRLIINRVGAIDLDLAERLHGGSAPRPYAVARNGQSLDVVSFDDALARALLASGEGARIACRRRRAEIAPDGGEGRLLRLAYQTATHFRVAGLDYLLPDPFHLFGGLMERWRALGWPEIPYPNARRIAASVETLRSVDFPTQAGHARRGFVGVARYDLVGLEPEERAAAWALVRLAEWRGVGAHTSYGMGRVRILRPGVRQLAGHVWESA